MRVQIITIVLTQMKISFDKQNFKKRISDIATIYEKLFPPVKKRAFDYFF